MKDKVLKVIPVRATLASLTWLAIFVAAMSAMMSYVIRPILNEWQQHAMGWLLGGDLLSLVAVTTGLMLLLVCFVLSCQVASVIVGHLFGGPTIAPRT
jgi:CDP-diglyceride synthetase